ncbi:MAG: hypothetical protein J5760_05140 [Clostridia bacterium]|nr:hypothetical protein [Clostridia bacterium]
MKKRINSALGVILAFILVVSCIPFAAGADDLPVYRVGEVLEMTDSVLFEPGAENIVEWAIMDRYFHYGEECVDVSDMNNWKMVAEGDVQVTLSVWYKDGAGRSHLLAKTLAFKVQGELKTVSSVALTGIPVPTQSEQPVYDVSAVKCGSGYSAVSVSWTDETDNNDDYHSAFVAGARYTVYVTVAAQGSVFSNTAKATVNGASANARLDDSCRTMTVSYTFTAKSKTPAPAGVDASGDVYAPAGTKAQLSLRAQTTVPGTALYYVWEVSDGNDYINIENEHGPVINVTVREGGSDRYRCNIMAPESGALWMIEVPEITVADSAFTETLTHIDIERVTAPELGASPELFATVAQNAVIESVSWYTAESRTAKKTHPLEGGFDDAAFYGVCVKVSGNFDKDLTAAVNGEEARVANVTANSAEICYTFAKLERFFIRQPSDKTLAAGDHAYASWQTNFVPVKAEIIDLDTSSAVHVSSRPAAEQAVPAVWYAEQGREYRFCARLYYGTGSGDYIQSDEFVYTVPAAVNADIEYIDIAGVTPPERAAHPDNACTVNGSAAYSVESFCWIPQTASGGISMSETDVFRSDGTQYIACFTVKAAKGHAFAPGCAASVNGYGAFTGKCGEKLVAVYNFGAAANPAPQVFTSSQDNIVLTDPSEKAVFTVSAEPADDKYTSYAWYAAGEDGPDRTSALANAASFTAPAIDVSESGKTFTYYCEASNELDASRVLFTFTCTLEYTEPVSEEPSEEGSSAEESAEESSGEEISGEPSDEISGDISDTESAETSEEISEGSGDLPEESEASVPEEASEEISEDISEDVSEAVSEEISAETSSADPEVSGEPSEEESETISEEVSEESSDETAPVGDVSEYSEPDLIESGSSGSWWLILLILVAAASLAAFGLYRLKKRKK